MCFFPFEQTKIIFYLSGHENVSDFLRESCLLNDEAVLVVTRSQGILLMCPQSLTSMVETRCEIDYSL